MADRVSHDDVRYVASLARLALDSSTVDQLARELNGILDHMEVLARVDTSAVAPFAQSQLDAMPLRDDT
ncbi:MAG TPA: Asp-tRNA(Asn)/Glu-tRNA(Gln) amidotransferase subunit GatC, partial [Gemmatimonadaceae bacterium]|nr:Asp-tRNA(Asn)/Glu-tRNA(Gln) amidotransferase subunit GatC [Gemmatimonadaceae bacterium]